MRYYKIKKTLFLLITDYMYFKSDQLLLFALICSVLCSDLNMSILYYIERKNVSHSVIYCGLSTRDTYYSKVKAGL